MPDDIQTLESRIEADRAMIGRSLKQLAGALSPGRVSHTIASEVQARGGGLGQDALQLVKANPAGALLIGAGLAALLAGPKRPEPEPAWDTRRREVSPGQSGRETLTGEFDARVAAADAASQSKPMAPRMRAALNRGLANLPPAARARVIRAREAAIEVQERLDRKAAIVARRAQSLHHRQPFVTGAVALGLGAVIAALLPRTRFEDETLGARRDALLQQAELALRDELASAAASGEAALREAIEAGVDRLKQAQ